MENLYMELIFAVGLTFMALVLLFARGRWHESGWSYYFLLITVWTLMVLSWDGTSRLYQAGHGAALYTAELPVVQEALALKRRPPVIERDLTLLRTGQRLDEFGLGRLRAAVTAERLREAESPHNAREAQARREIETLLAGDQPGRHTPLRAR
ncbi:MAG: hypothetical protein M0Z84_05610 [Gammaproteobacteria bacterium]|nr:hypothetical protein [Gammaproteobacteria bacterium]